jgi:hypothetical protein
LLPGGRLSFIQDWVRMSFCTIAPSQRKSAHLLFQLNPAAISLTRATCCGSTAAGTDVRSTT